jgi:peptidoglycan LD-endopeptidase LytH
MKRTAKQRATILPALVACLGIGIGIGWLLRSSGAPRPAFDSTIESEPETSEPATSPAPVPAVMPQSSRPSLGTSGNPASAGAASGAPLPAGAAIAELRQHNLRVPIDGASVEAMKGSFEERRDSGGRSHEAVDILAPRNTPIHATEDGTIAKLFQSKAGGTTIYEYDPSGRYCYYYAHLERYAAGLHDGQKVARGAVVGYVGTSGNAPPNTPHLHFAVFELEAAGQWWKGLPLDPYLIFRP